MHQQQSAEMPSFWLQGLIIGFIVLFLFFRNRRVYSRRRLEAVRNRPQTRIDEDKIIIALQLQGIIVDISTRKLDHFSKIKLQTTGMVHLLSKVKELFGVGLYYQPKASTRKLKSLLQVLLDNPKVDLYLYTRLNAEIAEWLLEKLHLSSFFRPECRRSSSEDFNQSLKHPTEVDCNTKRVIIVTDSQKDYLQEYSKYFLVLKRGDLSDAIYLLDSIARNNQDIDELHNQLAEIKVSIQSDYEGL